MRIMIFANLLVGDVGAFDMPPKVLADWQEDKLEALAVALEDARSRGAQACIVAGGLLAEGFVPQSLLEEALGELVAHGISATWVPVAREAVDIEARMEVPEGLCVLRGDAVSPVDGVKVVHRGSDIEVALSGLEGVRFEELPPLEPTGFGMRVYSGYLLVDIEGGCVESMERVSCALHPCVGKTVDLTGMASSRDMLEAVRAAIADVDEAACLRLALRGAIPLSAYCNTADLNDALNRRFFYAEVIDECMIDVEEEGLENDVGLLAEFIRLVGGDDSLSSTEKTRVMRCGWNALNGKELAE